MPNMKSIISNHNERILEESITTEVKPCNCRDTSNCLINGRCNVKSIVYAATVMPQEPPSTATDISMKQLANNVTPQQLSQTAANATNTSGSRKKKANKSKIMNYIGSCETTFKARFNNHTHSFQNRNKSNATELSKYYWNCLIHNNKPDIKWNIYTSACSYECGSGCCYLCLEEKIAILKSDKETTLNKRSEVLSKCRHENKFKLCNFKGS